MVAVPLRKPVVPRHTIRTHQNITRTRFSQNTSRRRVTFPHTPPVQQLPVERRQTVDRLGELFRRDLEGIDSYARRVTFAHAGPAQWGCFAAR
jgi:hypothetical protein